MSVAGPDHPAFLEELHLARETEYWVAERLLRTNLPVQVEPLVEAETPWEGADFVEQNDVLCGGHIVEVKGRNLTFTSPEDYPYPTAYLMSVKRWDRRQVKPVAIVLVSLPTLHALAVSTKTEEHWKSVSVYDTRRGYTTDQYEVAKEFTRPLDDLVDWFRR